MIVLDASALVDALLGRPTAGATANAIRGERALHAPHLVDVEVLHVLRRWAGRGELSSGRATTALADLGDLPLVRHPHAPLRARIWALRERLSAYDATYVSLAEALGATLVTADRRLARAAAGLVDVVEVA